jgi:cytochrome c556
MHAPDEASDRGAAQPGLWERRIRSLAVGILVLAFGVLAGVGARESSATGRAIAVQQGPDVRQPIALAAGQRDALLKEMRAMLAAMQGMMDGAAQLDVARIRAMAQSVGVRSIVGRDDALRDQLPEAYRQQEFEVRSAFDALADAVRGFTARDTTLAYLSRIAQKCVACHATYRLTTKP